MADLGAIGIELDKGVVGGFGAEVTGVVHNLTGDPVSHTVRAHFRASGEIANDAVSDAATGNYAIYIRYDKAADPLYVVEFDSTGALNARIFDLV